MKYQTRSYTCGPAAVVNAMRLLGVEVAEAYVGKLAGTTVAGTGCHGMKRALKGLGCSYRVLRTMEEVFIEVGNGYPVILHLDDESHWVVVCGCLGQRLVVFDSQRSVQNTAENGVRIISSREMGSRCYGLMVGVTAL